jgi:tetratricopeptide (TPR) repeat protein
MSQAYQRGIILYGHKRYDLAAQEFREELSQDPTNAVAHTQLALCLHMQGQREESVCESREAIRLAADNAYCHYALGWILTDLARHHEAESAALEAIRLQPCSADYHHLLARIATARARLPDALEIAERGLAFDPLHAGCLYLRSVSLVQLGKKQAAAETLETALIHHPADAAIHASQGWAFLHQGDNRHALEHFREALRLDPKLEHGRAGLAEALKARSCFYRQVLRVELWRGRQPKFIRYMFALGFVSAELIFLAIAVTRPDFRIPAVVLFCLSMGVPFVAPTANALFNYFLCFDRFGRHALSSDQRRVSASVGGCLLIPVVLSITVVVLVLSNESLPLTFCGMLIVPVCLTVTRKPGRPRTHAAICVLWIVLLAAPALSVSLLGESSPWKRPESAYSLFVYSLLLACLTTWLSAMLPSARSDK